MPNDKGKSDRDILLVDGDRNVERDEVAHFINDYFINVGNPLTTETDTSPRAEADPPLDVNVEHMALGEFDPRDVQRVVREINTSKSSGLENMSSLIIKEAFNILAPEVTFMYNLSRQSTTFPNSWKKALVIPIPKQGNLTQVKNFRPISLLPLPGKILEKLVHKQIANHLESEALLIEEQHGFRRGHSTIHSVAQFTTFVNKKLDIRSPTIATFIDFRKAFDCVQHPILLDNLVAMGLDNSVVEWVKSYLTERKQRVLANDTYSSYQTVTQGVPQGSVLGPLFYIVYANDLARIIKNCKIAMYADDAVLYISHPNNDIAVQRMQEDLDSLSRWCHDNSIMANTDKTKIMMFGSTNMLNKLTPFELRLEGKVLQRVTSYKYLGITLDSQLNYNLHVKRIVSTVSNKLKQLRRMRSFLNMRAALMVYKAMVLPIIEYGDVFLSATTAENRKRLQTLHNRGLRCALNKGIETSNVELHAQANLLH